MKKAEKEYKKLLDTSIINHKESNETKDSGKVPGAWLSGNIILIQKQGKSDEPKSYRPISILSCLGKLFTSILNKRLNAYSDEFLLINESQVGFRQGYSTNDNIFYLLSLFEP